MYNITLISTEHGEIGKCNSDELYKVIELIKPEIIFEEETDDEKYHRYYDETPKYFVPLEIKCIKKYLQNYNIKHIPVDIESNRYLSFREWDYMFDTFRKYDIYRKIEKTHCTLRDKKGFTYLNSRKCMELFDKTKITEKQLIEFSGIKKNELLRIYKLFHKEHDERENAMLLNIYNYSKEKQYNQAVFLLGFAHRQSIIHKIEECEKTSEIKLNWNFNIPLEINKK